MTTHVSAAPVIVLVHGYLDDETSWRAVASRLEARGFPTLAPRIAWEGDMGLQVFADTVAATITETAGQRPVILVGHSSGAQVAELAAAQVTKLVGLVLLAPVPLGGLQLPAEVVGPLRGCGENPEIQRSLRLQLSSQLSPADLDRLVEIGSAMPSHRVEAWFDAWTAGDPAAAEKATPNVPTVVVTANDPFVNDDILALVSTRYTSAEFLRIDGGGHWPHVESPTSVADAITAFVTSLSAPRDPGNPWTTAFKQKTETSFATGLAEDVELHASVLYKPILGRDAVAFTMQQASMMYDKLDFVAQASEGNLTFLEWVARTHTGMDLAGVTVLERDDTGLIRRVAIHHRGLAGVLGFSEEIGARTVGVVDPSHFWSGGDS